MGRLAILAWAFLGLLVLSADAEPQRRVALVIGNGTYAEAGTLANPYVPKDKSAARLTGKARVTLGLVKADDGWRIVSETSEPMN